MKPQPDETTLCFVDERRRQRDLQFKRLWDQLSEGVLVTDPAGTVLWANQAALRLTGWTVDALQGIHLGEMISIQGLKETVRVWGAGDDAARKRYRAFLQTRWGQKREILLSVGRTAELGAQAKLFLVRDSRERDECATRPPYPIEDREGEDRGSPGRESSAVIHELRNFTTTLLMAIDNLKGHLNDKVSSQDGMRRLEEIGDKIKCLVEKLG